MKFRLLIIMLAVLISGCDNFAVTPMSNQNANGQSSNNGVDAAKVK